MIVPDMNEELCVQFEKRGMAIIVSPVLSNGILHAGCPRVSLAPVWVLYVVLYDALEGLMCPGSCMLS